MSRTTLDIDGELIRAAMELSGARTKSETIELALRELIQRRQRDLLRQELGTFEFDLTPEELHNLRQTG